MGGRTVSVALACWRPALRGVWRQVLALALLAGLLGGVALGAVADARRTATAYGEYFGQDRATVLAGRLPPPGSTSTVVLTPAVAKALGTSVGGTVSCEPWAPPAARPRWPRPCPG